MDITFEVNITVNKNNEAFVKDINSIAVNGVKKEVNWKDITYADTTYVPCEKDVESGWSIPNLNVKDNLNEPL